MSKKLQPEDQQTRRSEAAEEVIGKDKQMNDDERYQRAAHAMQTGVEFSKDKTSQEPKHLRVGINSAMSDMGGLVTLLIEKGVFTHDEYVAAIADAMEREVESYRKQLQEEYPGSKITIT